MGGWRAAFGAGVCLRSWVLPCPMARHAADMPRVRCGWARRWPVRVVPMSWGSGGMADKYNVPPCPARDGARDSGNFHPSTGARAWEGETRGRGGRSRGGDAQARKLRIR
ncbi:hypothetical protein DA2_2562 [Desulfovibrio sp. A2]|nr:hypothetical protein DA2_2562 [Desulfovibrio sp. A2]